MQALPETLCYLNGEYLRLCDARVSVLDRGFLFGDGVYEVLPAYGRRVFRFDDHMARMERSLGKLGGLIRPMPSDRHPSTARAWTHTRVACRPRTKWANCHSKRRS